MNSPPSFRSIYLAAGDVEEACFCFFFFFFFFFSAAAATAAAGRLEASGKSSWFPWNQGKRPPVLSESSSKRVS